MEKHRKYRIALAKGSKWKSPQLRVALSEGGTANNDVSFKGKER